jgi:hypothetical protein
VPITIVNPKKSLESIGQIGTRKCLLSGKNALTGNTKWCPIVPINLCIEHDAQAN